MSGTTNQESKQAAKQAVPYSLKKGQIIFEIDLITGNIRPGKYKQLGKGQTKLIERKDCIYLPALNKTHAKKLFDNIVGTFEKTTLKDLKDEVEGK